MSVPENRLSAQKKALSMSEDRLSIRKKALSVPENRLSMSDGRLPAFGIFGETVARAQPAGHKPPFSGGLYNQQYFFQFLLFTT
jgi:hypothetical protein